MLEARGPQPRRGQGEGVLDQAILIKDWRRHLPATPLQENVHARASRTQKDESGKEVAANCMCTSLVDQEDPDRDRREQQSSNHRHPQQGSGAVYQPPALCIPDAGKVLLIAQHNGHKLVHNLLRLLMALALTLSLRRVLHCEETGMVWRVAPVVLRRRGCLHNGSTLLIEPCQGVLQPAVKLQLATDKHQNPPEGEDQNQRD
mmetsp:Transcript_64403/g.153611  ORF Transcript_64403/g.153611 Transcript_64403/m.153611 type:complete len:203 (+) Transcript_64403:553-1161(+)